MPSLGSDMDVGTVLEWRVAAGDEVHQGRSSLLDVDTEKSEIEVEVWQDGVVAELLVPAGSESRWARRSPGWSRSGPRCHRRAEESPPAADAQVTEPETVAVAEQPVADVAVAVGPEAADVAAPSVDDSAQLPHRHREAPVFVPTPRTVFWPAPVVSPAPTPVVTPSAVVASEPRSAPRSDADDQPTDRASRIRLATAEVMSRSSREIPHYHLTSDIDLGPALGWLAAENEQLSAAERILPAAVLVKATAMTAAARPELNGFWTDGGFVPADAVNVAMAVHLRTGGLVAPAIVGADRLDLDEIMTRLRDLVARARVGRLRSAEMADGTITVTNLGDRGTDAVAGVIFRPQVALVGFGRIRERPAVVDGELTVRPLVTVTLSADHRATDGQTGARFVNHLDSLLQRPEDLASVVPRPEEP